MNAQDLKNSILQLAIQGKLVEQREEGTAKELLKKIEAEKKQLTIEGKIKKQKPLPEIKEDEIPFDIPESWEWVRLGATIHLTSGQDMTPSKYNDVSNGIPYLTGASNIQDGELIINRWTPEPRAIALKGDILLTCKGTVGKTVILYEEEVHIARQIMSIRTILTDAKFIEYFVKSYISILKSKAKSMIPGIERKDVLEAPIPLPPLEEQKRIVAKIEELIPYVEKYDVAYSELKGLNKKFPDHMQKSILQYAIQGKLTEQREDEGTAEELYQQIQEEKSKLIKEGKIKKEKPLPEITADEIPFDIPESWKWVRLGSLCEKIGSGSTPTGGKSVYKERGIKFIRSQNIYNDGLRMGGLAYISEEQNKQGSIVKPRDILLNITGGSIGRCALVPDDFDIANINQHVMIIRNVVLETRFLLHFILTSHYIQSMIMSVQVGVSREGLSAEKLKKFLIPLPPLEEHKRIVAKIEELMPYTKQLNKQK